MIVAIVVLKNSSKHIAIMKKKLSSWYLRFILSVNELDSNPQQRINCISNRILYTKLSNLYTKYHVICKVYTHVGGIKYVWYVQLSTKLVDHLHAMV